jgi:hypothetical protein
VCMYYYYLYYSLVVDQCCRLSYLLIFNVQYGDVDGRGSSYLKAELLTIIDREKSWREKLWKNGIVKSSRLAPRKCPQYVGTEEVLFVFNLS